MNKRLLIISNCILVLFFLNIERTNAQNQHIELFQLSDVEISNSPFRDAMYASGGSEKAYDRLEYMLKELRKVQEANGKGYVGDVHVTSSVRQSVGGDLVFNSDFMMYLSVSSCGCHDNKMWWNEQFIDYPIGQHYAKCFPPSWDKIYNLKTLKKNKNKELEDL